MDVLFLSSAMGSWQFGRIFGNRQQIADEVTLLDEVVIARFASAQPLIQGRYKWFVVAVPL